MVPSPPEAGVVALLTDADLSVRGFLANASNHTLLVQVGALEAGVLGVYKPRAGERPLWDFPPGTLCQREVAAYRVSAFLGWDIVPPTVLRDGPLGIGSLQLFVPHDPQEHYFTLYDDERHHDDLARLAVFDLLVNNADRKGSHVLWSEADQRLFGIDHGVTFHDEPKLRTVIWDFGGAPILPAWQADMERLAMALEAGDAIADTLAELLSPAELRLLGRRARLLARTQALPEVPSDRRPYPWPPL